MRMWVVLGGITLTAALFLGALTTFTAPTTTQGHLLLALVVSAVSFLLGVAVVALTT